jgi:hypothetical protein
MRTAPFVTRLVVLRSLLVLAACTAGAPPASDEPAPSSDASQVTDNRPESAASPKPATGSPADSAQASCGSAADPFSKDAMHADIAYLADDARQGRFPGTPGDEETLTYIEQRFRCIGLKAPFDGDAYRQPFVGAGLKTGNIAAYIEGTDPAGSSEIIVVGAHHDHRGVKKGQIQNGANDNASGVAGVLALAKAMHDAPPRRTIVFATFGYEENDDDGTTWGSDWFVHHMPASLPLDRVVYMMNLDMLGTYPTEKRLDTFGTFKGTMGRAVLEAKKTAFPELKVKLGEVPEENDSDFQPFCNAGIPYVYLATEDDCWHEACDDTDHIDWASLSSVTKLAHAVVVDLANGTTDLKTGRRTTPTCTQ